MMYAAIATISASMYAQPTMIATVANGSPYSRVRRIWLRARYPRYSPIGEVQPMTDSTIAQMASVLVVVVDRDDNRAAVALCPLTGASLDSDDASGAGAAPEGGELLSPDLGGTPTGGVSAGVAMLGVASTAE